MLQSAIIFKRGTKMQISNLSDRERVLLDVLVDNETGCWNWARSKTNFGYGQLHWKGTNRRAHVLAYKAFVGPVGDLCVLHRCDNTACCNPDHLFLGTRNDNTQDMVQKGRARGGTRKFSSEKINEFRQRRWNDGDSVKELAAEAGVHQSTMSRMTSKRSTRYAYVSPNV